MTHDHSAPNTDLPKFSVNVVPTGQITSEHLGALLERYRRGEIEPLIFGDGNAPEAAVIPFVALVRLMKQDHASYVRKEGAFQAELTQRVQASDAARASGEPSLSVTVEELAESLEEPARSMFREQLSDE